VFVLRGKGGKGLSKKSVVHTLGRLDWAEEENADEIVLEVDIVVTLEMVEEKEFDVERKHLAEANDFKFGIGTGGNGLTA